MKKIIVVATVLCISLGVNAQSTNGQAVQLAQHIAKKMKDTLSLTGNQKNQIYDVNMQLHNQKQEARAQNAGNAAQLTQALQNVEKTRDSLYKPILTTPQYNLYKQKKRNLISAN